MKLHSINKPLYSSDGSHLYQDRCPTCGTGNGDKLWTVAEAFILALNTNIEEDKNRTIEDVIAIGDLLKAIRESQKNKTALEIRSNDKKLLKNRVTKIFGVEIAYQLINLLDDDKNPFERSKDDSEPTDTEKN